MSRTRRKVLWFVATVSGVTAIVQWPGLSSVLDGMLGMPWSSSIVIFLKANTQGLVILILLSLFFEFIGFDESKQRIRDRDHATAGLLDMALESTPERALIANCLRRLYGESASLQLTNYVMSRLPVLRDVRVRIRVGPTANGAYEIRTVLAYETVASAFRVALTTNHLKAETLLASGEFSEVVVIQDLVAVGKAGVPTPPFSVAYRTKLDDGTTVVADLEWSLLTGRALQKLSKRLPSLQSDCCVFESGLPPRHRKGDSQQVRYEMTTTTTQTATKPFTFWLSERVLYLRSIDIDLSALGALTCASASVHLFIAAVTWAADINPREGVWSIPVDAWLVNGQGVMVAWSPAGTPVVAAV